MANCFTYNATDDPSAGDGNSTVSAFVFNVSSLHIPDEFYTMKSIQRALDTYVLPALCVLGIIGNILNVAVLSHRRLYHNVEHLERSALTGLLALAVSDMLLCASIFILALKDPRRYSWPSVDFWLLYGMYSGALINTWMLCSAWLTVSLAVCRYLAVCRPLYARSRSQSTGIIVGTVVISSALLNLPRYWDEVMRSVSCTDGQSSYYAVSGPLHVNETLHLSYICIYFTVGIVLPIITLVYCTSQLLKALRQSRTLRRQHSSSKDSVNSNRNLVTTTLCAVVIFYILFVAPAELLNFFRRFMRPDFSIQFSIRYSLAVSVCNSLQVVNFSFHFLLYCIVNAHFRRVAVGLLSCVLRSRCCVPGLRRSRFESQAMQDMNQSLTPNTTVTISLC